MAVQAGLGFGGLLRRLRDEAGLTQDELAEAARVSQRAISDLERGINRTARKDTAVLLAGALGLDGRLRVLFVAAARGRGPADAVLAALTAPVPAEFAAPSIRALPGDSAAIAAAPPVRAGLTGAVVLLFTDIDGSTGLVQRLGAKAYGRVLAAHHALIRSALAAHGGVELDTLGDGFFAGFSSAGGCVAAVLAMQQALGSHDWPGGEAVRVRMGVHAGEAELTAAGVVGLDVHRAARIAAVAHGGQVLVSETAAALARDWLPDGVGLMDLGVHRLKDLGRPERLFQVCGPGLAAQFPPVRSLGNPALPNNLPAQLSSFVGRDRELKEVRALVESSRLVTLTGAGGCGKTRLALQVAADLLDGSGDGVWLVDLAAVTDPDAVPAAVGAALRIPPQPGRPVLDVLADALAWQQLLIVLDNCEHLIGGCAATAETILQRCPKVRLIATSREPLGIAGEQIYRVPSLSLPQAGDAHDDDDADPAVAGSGDAVALLADRAAAQGVRLTLDPGTVELAVSVCRQLDGLPLAIELAAARLRSMSLADLAGRLDQRFRLLTGGSRTALARQQTLAATVSWSYSLLAPAEQGLLGRLSVFAGSFDLAAAEQVCGHGSIDRLDVAALVGSLSDKNLIAPEPDAAGLRYRLLETIRLFAAGQLTEADGQQTAAVAAAHCAHYLAVAETAAPHLTGPEQGSWLRRLEAEDANLRRAVEHAAADPDGTAQVLRFAIALKGSDFALRYGADEWAGLLLPVLRHPDAATEPAVFAQALFAAAGAVGNDNATGLRLAEQMDEVATELGDNRLLAMSRMLLSNLHWARGDLERARPLAQESVQRARQLGDDVQLARSLSALSLTCHPVLGLDPGTAAPIYAEAIACTERSGDLSVNCVLHNAAGCYRLYLGDLPAARAHLEAAIRAAEMLGEPRDYVLDSMGEVLQAEGDFDGARSAYQDALRLSHRTGRKVNMAGALLHLANLAAETGQWHQAATLHGASRALQDQTGVVWDPDEEGYRQESLGQIAAAIGEDQLNQAYSQGTAHSLDHVIDLALGRAPG